MQPLNQAQAGVDFSIIIPTYNGRRTIVACLASVQRAVQGRRGEVIVVDSSTDDTAALVREQFPAVTLIRSEVRLSAGGARNRGISVAQGRLIFFTDQDCIVPADWISRMESHFANPAVHGVGGSLGINNVWSPSGCALYFLEFLNHFPGSGRVRPHEKFLVGCNSAYRAEVVRSVAFPDRTLGEDVLFGYAVRTEGWRTVYDPQIEVAHENRTGWKTFFAYNHKMGRAAASYHSVLRLRWATPFLRFPALAFVAPAVVLPSIAADLVRSRPSYLWRFLLLLPLCFLGNLAWATGFLVEGRALLRKGAAEPVLRQAADADWQTRTHPAPDHSPPPPTDSGLLLRRTSTVISRF